ncbi:hypothetical protein AB0903_33660 [Streptomyces sp. NPDC048389]|uniref:hypothetical protein n=1 Tax=Streptomyces sp. NPDC048389 TaxID=3154622 RepID=UPI003455408D
MVVEPGSGAALDLRPDRVRSRLAVALLPAALVAEERGGLEGEHAVTHGVAVTDHASDLVEVARGDGHVVSERLGYLSPIEFEEKHYAEQATAERANLRPRQPLLTS